MSENSNFDDSDFVPPETDFVPPEDDEDFVPPPRDLPPQDPSDNTNQWVIPIVAVGCGCIGLPLLAIALGLFGIGNMARRLYQSTGTYQVYQLASEAVQTNATVIETLGSPVETGWTSKSREFYEANDTGKVCMRFNVTGDDSSGSAYAEAQNIAGAWQLHQLVVMVNGQPEPLTVVPLEPEETPLCPGFDDPDSDFDETPPENDDPDLDEAIPGQSTEI